MLLSDEEISQISLSAVTVKDATEDVRAIEAAILAKLAAKDLPEPVGAYELVVGQEEWQGCPSEIIEMRDAYSAEQLNEAHAQGFAAGAASQLSAEPVAKYIGPCPEGDLVALHDDLKVGEPLYTRREA